MCRGREREIGWDEVVGDCPGVSCGVGELPCTKNGNWRGRFLIRLKSNCELKNC